MQAEKQYVFPQRVGPAKISAHRNMRMRYLLAHPAHMHGQREIIWNAWLALTRCEIWSRTTSCAASGCDIIVSTGSFGSSLYELLGGKSHRRRWLPTELEPYIA